MACNKIHAYGGWPEILEIDLKIDPRFANNIKRDSFEVRPKMNYQAQAGWVTGWQVSHSTNDIATVMKWLYRAFLGGNR